MSRRTSTPRWRIWDLHGFGKTGQLILKSRLVGHVQSTAQFRLLLKENHMELTQCQHPCGLHTGGAAAHDDSRFAGAVLADMGKYILSCGAGVDSAAIGSP